MPALVEVHNGIELETAIRVRCDLIGINNRNLHNFITDIVTTEDLASRYEGPALLVSESGIETRADIERLFRAGASAFLVGESLLRDRRPGDRLRELIGEARNQ